MTTSDYQTLKTRQLRTGKAEIHVYVTRQQYDFILKFAYRMGISKSEAVRRALNVFIFEDRRLPRERIKTD
jgi:hypothetical protein